MRPLEMHLELSCHVALLSRVKEVMDREGLLPPNAGREEIKAALVAWFDFIEAARQGRLHDVSCGYEETKAPWH